MAPLAIAAALPGASAGDEATVRCGGPVASGGAAACHVDFLLPHFDEADDVDYDRLVADLLSPLASDWSVSARLFDASGVNYFLWSCEGELSSRSPVTSTYVLSHHCSSSRPALFNHAGGYDDVDTSGPQRLDVEVSASACLPALPAPECAFAAEVTFLLHP